MKLGAGCDEDGRRAVGKSLSAGPECKYFMLYSVIICHLPGSGAATPLCQLSLQKQFRGGRVKVDGLDKKLKSRLYSWKSEG